MTEKLPDIIPLEPYYREMVWGGRRLQELYAKALPPAISIGETFELSAYKGRESVAVAGPCAGRSLCELFEVFGEKLIGAALRFCDFATKVDGVGKPAT